MLYKRLCETVIAKLNKEYFKKKMDVVARGRRAATLAMTPFAIALAAAAIILVIMAYIGAYWFAFENEKDMLTAAIDEVTNNHNTYSQEALTMQKDAFIANRATDNNQKTVVSIDSVETTLENLKQDFIAEGNAIKFANDLIKLEDKTASELGPLEKLTGDIPHPAVILYFILKNGSFNLEQDFLAPRKVSVDLLKKVGLSPRAADTIALQISKIIPLILGGYEPEQKIEPAEQPYALPYFSQITRAGSATFGEAQEQLRNYRGSLSEKIEETKSNIEKLETEIDEAKRSSDIAMQQKLKIDAAIIEASKAIEAGTEKTVLAVSKFKLSVSNLSFFDRDFIEFRSLTLPSEDAAVIEAAQKVKDAISDFSGFLNTNEYFGKDAGELYSKNMNAPMTKLTSALSAQATFETFRSLKTSVFLTIVLIVAAALVVFWMLRYFWRLYTRYRRFGPEAGLVRMSEEKIRRLDFDITRSQSRRFDLPIFRSSASISNSEQMRGRPLTLPGLTADYMEYIKQVQKVFRARAGNPKLIICIDELDKITNTDEVGKVLREIKGALFQDNCFYILSISEDAVRAFESRFVEERDIFESTFDEVMFLERLNLPTCVSIARKRFESSGYGPEEGDNPSIDRSIELAAIVSAGVPREFIRNLRVMVASAEELTQLDPIMVWHHLLRRKLKEARQRIRTVDVREGFRAELIADFDDMIGELDTQLACENPEFKIYTENSFPKRLSNIAKRCEELKEEVRKVEETLTNDLSDARQHRLNLELGNLKAWRKLWLELLIYLTTWRSYLMHTKADNSEALEKDFTQLISTYAVLPYNSDICETYLRKMDGFSQIHATG